MSNNFRIFALRLKENTERRVRQRGTKQDGFTFYYTEKTDIGPGERIEKEEKTPLLFKISLYLRHE